MRPLGGRRFLVLGSWFLVRNQDCPPKKDAESVSHPSPGLRRTRYPGSPTPTHPNPEEVADPGKSIPMKNESKLAICSSNRLFMRFPFVINHPFITAHFNTPSPAMAKPSSSTNGGSVQKKQQPNPVGRVWQSPLDTEWLSISNSPANCEPRTSPQL